MSNVFEGVCAGGPMDGQVLAHTTPRFRVMIGTSTHVHEDHGEPLALRYRSYRFEDGVWTYEGEDN